MGKTVNEIIFTIVIPHYNNISGLKRLFDSIPDSSFIEVILVDDRSTKIKLDDVIHSQSFVNFKFFSNEEKNKGAGSCRNIGLNHASGKYILFADSDDFFLQDAFTSLVEIIKYKPDYDIYFLKPTSLSLITGLDSDRHIYYCKLVDDYLETGSDEIRFNFHVPWSKVYLKEFLLVNSITFDEVIASNDVMFSLKSGHLAKNIIACDNSIYCVTRGESSLTVTYTNSIMRSRYLVELDRLNYINRFNLNTKKISFSGMVRAYHKCIKFFDYLCLISKLFNREISLLPKSKSIKNLFISRSEK
ncbi:glycosyltransferase family A protein [Vibrio rumoiensis]|uniref:Glycosyltransferase family A protein n=1 Tax=Vibrio rumoiensis TaxID=76258 RepID=A0ABW7IRH5_9VIBR